MRIELNRLTLSNFKGVQCFDLALSGHDAVISGGNGTGKTTVFDAWLWLLFDMDSRGNKGADAVKTTSGANFVHYLTHEVTAEITVDGKVRTLRKALTENWVKPRGKTDQEFSGNVSKYWIDDIPMQLKDYQVFINDLIPSDLFKIISDPMYFSTSLNWKDRLNMLVEISGGISEEEIVAGDKDLEKLLVKMGDKSFADFKKMTLEKIRLLNNEIEGIPARIDECRRAIPEEADYSEIENEIIGLKAEIERLDKEEFSLSERMKLLLLAQDTIYRLKRERVDLINNITDEANEGHHTISREIQTIVSEINTITQNRQAAVQMRMTKNGAKIGLENVNADLRAKYVGAQTRIRELASEQFEYVPSDETCPTCGQRLPEETISLGVEKLRKNYEDAKRFAIAQLEDSLLEINETGKSNKGTIAILDEELAELSETLDRLDAEKAVKEERLAVLRDSEKNSSIFLPAMAEKDPRITAIDGKILALEIETAKTPTDAVSDIRKKKTDIRNQIDMLNRKLSGKSIKDQMEKRIAELEFDLSNKATAKTALEGDIYQTERFVRARTEKLEGKINGMFTKVGFKLFSEQVNGGLSETCEAIVNNTTFSKANTAGQINAGMDIIRTISRYKGIYVPVFVDHLESINSLLALPSQVISLLVSDEATLKVSVNKTKEEVA